VPHLSVVVAVVIILATATWFGHARTEYRTPEAPEMMTVDFEHAHGELKRTVAEKGLKIDGVKESNPETFMVESET
jgi:hypothetical protein